MDIAAEPAEEFNLDSYSAAALETLLGEGGNNGGGAGGGQHQLQQGCPLQNRKNNEFTHTWEKAQQMTQWCSL